MVCEPVPAWAPPTHTTTTEAQAPFRPASRKIKTRKTRPARATAKTPLRRIDTKRQRPQPPRREGRGGEAPAASLPAASGPRVRCGAERRGLCSAARPKTRAQVAAAARRWRKWSGEEGVVVSVWRRRRESFLQLHFRSAFCSERERRNERETHTGLLPPPPSPPSLRRYRLTRHHQAAGRDAPADWRIGSRAGGDAPPVARAPGRVFVSVSMWEKEEEEEEEAAICLLGWSPPGSTCSPHWGDGRGAVATPPPGPDYSLSPQRPRPPLGFRRRFAQVNSCSLFRRRRRRRRQVLSVSPPRSPPRRFLSGPRSPPRASLEFAPLWWQPPWVAVVLYPLPAGSGGGDWAPAGRPGRRRPGGECRPRASGIYLSSGIRRAPGWAELLLVGDRPRPGEEL